MVLYRLFALFLCFVLFSCKTRDNSQLMQENLRNEINNRLAVLTDLGKKDDSLNKLVLDLHNQSQRFILLSRDHENPMTSVMEANTYFGIMAKAVTDKAAQPMQLMPTMSPTQIQLGIQQNELWLLNNIIFLSNGKDVTLFSVVEKTISWH